MGTRGYKAWRFRKRYYFEYNHWDSYPEGLGKELANTIPSDPDEYATWLEAQRKLVGEWAAAWDNYLAVDPDDSDPQTREAPNLADFMKENHPSWMVPLNDVWIEWVYIIDLDREIFSVNNGAHFKLGQIPHINWIEALDNGGLGDKIVLPNLVPEEAIANLVEEPSTVTSDAVTGTEQNATEQVSSHLSTTW